MKTLLIYSFFILATLLSGCNKDKIPGVYRIDIQQGNAVTQDMLNKLKPGMTKTQVAYVMGTPLIIDTFHPNRWDYVYTFHPGNGQREERKVTVYFTDDEKLSHIEGDVRTVDRENLPQSDRKESNIVVPLAEKKTGIFQGILNTVGLGEDEPKLENNPVDKTKADKATVSPKIDSDKTE